MRLELDASLGRGYDSASQWARRVTEGWASLNLYCAACPSDFLQAHRANWAVDDYQWLRCSRRVQLKAKNGPIGRTVANSAYEKKIGAIRANRAPDYCFLSYDRQLLTVRDLIWVPGHFMTLGVVSRRQPLDQSARRAGWVGSTIHLDRIPSQGKIGVIVDGRAAPQASVRRRFKQLAFLRTFVAETRGWLTDVLACLDDLALRTGSTFTNDDLYAFEGRLAELHLDNVHIRPKLRQQLQVLEKHRVIERLSPGQYRKL